MKRVDLEHLLRAAASIVGVSDLVVIGSQAILGAGWRGRLVPGVCEAAEPAVVGWCLEPHDLWVSKAAAGREKDREFCVALAHAGLVDDQTCLARIAALDDPYRTRAGAVARVAFR